MFLKAKVKFIRFLHFGDHELIIKAQIALFGDDQVIHNGYANELVDGHHALGNGDVFL